MYYYGRRNDGWQKIAITAIAFVFIGLLLWFIAESSDKMMRVIFHNFGFWIMIGLAFLFGLVRKLTNPEEFKWVELPIQLFISLVVITGLYGLFFSTSADLTDTEIWNGGVAQAEYYEEWTELVTYTEQVATGTDSKGNTTYTTVVKTRRDYHSPEWKIVTTLGSMGIGKEIYKNYVEHFGNQKKKDLFRMNQVSSGNGNMHYIVATQLPASQNRQYVNYLRASESIRKVSGFISTYKNFLMPYPSVYSGKFGPIEINRVIDAKANLPKEWKEKVDKRLDIALISLGANKQANILVYAVGTSDQAFINALEESWVKGKKNDIIVVLGITNFPSVDFVYIMAWTKVEEFKIELRNKLLSLDNLSDPDQVSSAIISQVQKPPNEGGFKRMPMADLEYLIADIKLPMWCQILIVLIGGAVCWGVSVFMIKNNI
jgi:phosphotransferase system HPr-like phosphotransfer protein